MSKIPNADLYDNFAYHTALLNDFSNRDGGDPVWMGNAASLSASLGRRRRRLVGRRHGGGSLTRGGSFSNLKTPSSPLNNSVRSAGSGQKYNASKARSSSHNMRHFGISVGYKGAKWKVEFAHS
jgi:hypothetical protein